MAAICLVGAGRIGLPVAHRLVAAGHSVEAVDVEEGRRAAVEAAGARWAGPSLGTVPSDGVLITVLPGSAELRHVMLGSSAALSRLAPGTSWVDMTSAAPDLAAELAAAAASRGVRYVDAAIGGGPAEAARGELSLYVGGAEADVEWLRPILQDFAGPGHIFHMGNSGAGYLTKLLINQLWFGQALAVTEALLLAADSGLPPDRLAPVLRSSAAGSAFLDRHLPALLAGDYLPSFGLDRVVEELDSLARLAETAGVPWPVSKKVAEVHRQALAHFGDEDGELLGAAWLEHLAGWRLADMRTVI